MLAPQTNIQDKRLFTLSLIRTALIAAACLGLCIALAIVVPKATRLLDEADEALDGLAPTLAKMQDVADNLAVVSQELEDADLPALVEKTTTLIEDGQQTIDGASVALEETLAKVKSLDLDTLNDAIGDLSAIIDPLARLFGR